MNKHFFNALIYDIVNWSTKISIALFLLKADKFYGTLIIGLQVLRFVADFIYKKALQQDLDEAQNQIVEKFEKAMQEKYPGKTMDEIIALEITKLKEGNIEQNDKTNLN